MKSSWNLYEIYMKYTWNLHEIYLNIKYSPPRYSDLPTNILLVRLLESMKTERSLLSCSQASRSKHDLQPLLASSALTSSSTTTTTSPPPLPPTSTPPPPAPTSSSIPRRSFSRKTSRHPPTAPRDDPAPPPPPPTSSSSAAPAPAAAAQPHPGAWISSCRGDVADVRARRRSLRPAAKAIYNYAPLASGDLRLVGLWVCGCWCRGIGV